MPNTQARRSGSEAGCDESGGTMLPSQEAQPGVTLNGLSCNVAGAIPPFDCAQSISHCGDGTKGDRTDTYK